MPMYTNIYQAVNALMTIAPAAFAEISGSRFFPAINGAAMFYPFASGTLLAVHVIGLPSGSSSCSKQFFGFHIHEGSQCSGDSEDPFSSTGAHYNPGNCQHPQHAGDLPPLLGNQGEALSIFYIDSFSPEQVIGHTLVIHEMTDDLHSQPAGNSGMKIACGEITSFSSRRGL